MQSIRLVCSLQAAKKRNAANKRNAMHQNCELSDTNSIPTSRANATHFRFGLFRITRGCLGGIKVVAIRPISPEVFAMMSSETPNGT